MKKVRIAIVGTGWIASAHFMPGTAKVKNAEITALVTGHVDKAKPMARKFGASYVVPYEEYENFLDAGLVDAVYVALPNDLHARYALAALKRGIHALVEKPLTRTLAESEALIAAAKKGKALLMTAMRLHTNAATLQFIDLVRSGVIGEPRMAVMSFSFSINADNHRLKAKAWGGPLQDIGVYCVNALRHVFGAEPSEVSAMNARNPKDKRFRQVDENMSALLRFPNDAVGVFSCSFGAAEQDKITVTGTKGQIEMHSAYLIAQRRKIIITTAKGRREIIVPPTDDFAGQTSYFVDSILARRKVANDGAEGLADMRVLLAVEKAAATGKSVALAKSKRKVPRLRGTLRKYPMRG